MTEDQIRLVQASFALVKPIQEAAAELFYCRLMEIDPSTRPLFAATDTKKQGAKLMAAIAFVVHGLTRPETILDPLRALARRHVAYGVEDRHYESVGTALLWTLEVGLGVGWTPGLRDAWAAAYGLLSGAMIEAAHQATADLREAA
jgi:hemoglobin-like flavoprotein